MTHYEHRDVSRWTDNPFTPPNASPELLEWYDKRDKAIRIWRKTGDDTMAIEIGLFPSKEEEALDLHPADLPEPPIPNSYWVKPGRFAAGEYPGAPDLGSAEAKLRDMLEAGIDHFIDLTGEADRLKPYIQIAEKEASHLGRSVNRESHPITDLSVPRRPEEMTSILDAIDNALDNDRTVYVHCWGGVGRTGTVVGCWLVTTWTLRRGGAGPGLRVVEGRGKGLPRPQSP